MIKLIEQKIKELYGSKASFCDTHGHKYKDFASKLRTFKNRVNWLNEFIAPLGLEIRLTDRDNIIPDKKTNDDNLLLLKKYISHVIDSTNKDFIDDIITGWDNQGFTYEEIKLLKELKK
jgi:hypothetical protein